MSAKSTVSEKLAQISPSIANVLDTIAIIITEDFFSSSYEYAKKSTASMSLADRYRLVVNKKMDELRKNNTQFIEFYLSHIREKYNKVHATGSTDRATNVFIFEKVSQYLMPGESLTAERQYKLYVMLFRFLMEQTREFVFANIQYVVSKAEPEIERRNADLIRKNVLTHAREFQLVKIPEMKTGSSGPSTDNSIRAALLQVTAERAKAMLRIKELEEEIEVLKTDKSKLLNALLEARRGVQPSKSAVAPYQSASSSYQQTSTPYQSTNNIYPSSTQQAEPKEGAFVFDFNNDDNFTLISSGPEDNIQI
jgi:hypothetical protein